MLSYVFVTFAAFALQSDIFGGKLLPTGPSPKQVIGTDMNGDGRIDWITSNRDFSGGIKGVSILSGLPDGQFAPAVHYATNGVGWGVMAGDVNGDANPDLVTNDNQNGTVSVLLSNGAGGFLNFQPVLMNPIQNQGVILTDFNSDGALDLALTGSSGSSGAVFVRLGAGNGAFAPVTPYAIGDTLHYSAVGDFNLDGKLDITAA